jgi:kanamycin kinase
MAGRWWPRGSVRKVSGESRLMSVPAVVAESHLEWQWEMVWSHVPQLNTWRLRNADGHARFLKLTAADWAVQAKDEAERMRWLQPYVAVPEVIEQGEDEQVTWLLTEGLPGNNAVAADLLANPKLLVSALGRGLRRFHEAPPAGNCPFRFTNDIAVERVRERVSAGEVTEEELRQLESLMPESEDLVVCHGDPCLPNFLVLDGEVSGYVDLGDLGVADRWRDIAISLWSVTHNLGEGWEELFLESYGIRRDEGRVAFYQELYERL